MSLLSAAPINPIEKLWKLFGEVHKSIYLGSAGRLGSRLAWIPMLLLSTQGRKTGLIRTMPLAYIPDPEDAESFVVVASNGGSESSPAWWLNLRSNAVATVQIGRESFLAIAEQVPDHRRGELWQTLRRRIPPYQVYERIEREIPIVLLRRLPPSKAGMQSHSRMSAKRMKSPAAETAATSNSR
jgi:deazaflavin-dependent oxidoreductase (nitroreductase family)